MEGNIVKNENNEFRTRDIQLATFLSREGITLKDIVPISLYKSEFIFERLPESLSFKDQETANRITETKEIVEAYKHLLRFAKEASKGVWDGSH